MVWNETGHIWQCECLRLRRECVKAEIRHFGPLPSKALLDRGLVSASMPHVRDPGLHDLLPLTNRAMLPKSTTVPQGVSPFGRVVWAAVTTKERLALGEIRMLAGPTQWSPVPDTGGESLLAFGRCARWTMFVVIVWGVSLVPNTASGHKMFVFAAVRGDRIEGEVYYQGGDPAQDAKIVVTAPDGTTVAQTEADQEGGFRFEARWKMDYRIVADAGFGHRAEYVIPADELPTDLPAFGADPSPADEQPPEVLDARSTEPPTPILSPPSDLAPEITALSQQISALRRDLDRWQARLRTQDVLGGIGYILGLMGLGSYLLRHKKPVSGQTGRPPS